MLKMEEFLVIRDLYRKTVRKYTSAKYVPRAQTRRSKPSKLDPYKEYIQNRLSEYPLSAARIHREIQEQGFTGGYTIVKEYIRKIRPAGGTPAVVRYETEPGVQAQVDWGECGHLDVDGRRRKLYCFSMILGYSRMRYLEPEIRRFLLALWVHVHAHSKLTSGLIPF